VRIADTVREEISGYLLQEVISSPDIHRMCCLLEGAAPGRAELVGLVLQVALVKPQRRGRTRYLRTYRPGLLRALQEAGLVNEDGTAPE
jgi:hypothetical protein